MKRGKKMNIMKKIISTILIFVLMVSVVGGMPQLKIEVDAAGVSLDYLKSKYPQGKYWNGGNADTYTSTPCTHHGSCSYSGSCGCNTFKGHCIQCMGFAYQLAYLIYGGDPYKDFSINKSSSALDSLKAGDIVCYKNGGHYIFVCAVNGNTVTYADCNSDGHCIIRWGQTISKSTIKATFTSVDRAPYAWNSATSSLTVDSNYPTPIKAYTMGTGKTTVYSSVDGSAKSNKIYDTDLCTINSVYTNGWCYVTFPLDAGGTDEGYVKTSVFFNTSSREKMTVTTQTTTYSRSDCATSVGYIGAGDEVIKVGSSGGLSQVIYPLTAGGYKCAWASLATAPVDSSYNVPFKCRIISTVKVKCYNDVNYTSSPGNIYPEDDCVITAIYDNGKVQCQCPWSDGSTKTVYIDKSAFINSSSKPKNSKAVKYAKTYLRTDMSTNVGWIDAGDAIQIVATSGDKTQIIYPADVGKRCAWVYTSDLTKTYKISYNANGGSGAPAAQTKTSGVGLTLSSTKPSYDGHTFLGWATSASATSASYSAGGAFNTDADTTLYAVWRANQYNISYNANGGTGAPEAQTKIHGTAVTISKTIPTLEGYTFIGWSTDKTATSATYSAGSSYTENKSIELFAVWKANTYNVSYSANGGANAPTTQTKIHDIDLKLSDDIPAKNGYNFVGWSLSADGTEANYQPGDYYYDNSSATLYAVWLKIETPKVKISVEPKTAEVGATISVPVKLTENNGIAYIKFTAEYDADVFELVGATNGSIFAMADFDRSGNNFQWSSSDNNTATGTLVTLNFRVKDAASAGEYQIGINVKACYNSSEISADVNTTNGSITVNKTTIDENSPQIVVSNERGNLGKTVDVTVSLANNPGIIGTRFTLSYDTSKLSLTAVNNGSVFADSTFISSDSISAMPYTVYWEDALASSNNTSNGTLVTFTFKVLDNAETGSTPIEITVDDGSTFNYDLDNVKFVAVNGSIDISNRTPGDVNGDGVVNSKDLVILRRYLANWNNVEIDESNADVNGDGVVNTKDVVIIKRYLAGWNVTLV